VTVIIGRTYRGKWEDNIKIDFKGIECEGVG
jgi:hypothetical protein